MEKARSTDYFFWILLILFTNPGGIQQALGINEVFGKINLNDLLFPMLFTLYLVAAPKSVPVLKESKQIKYAILFFGLYYFTVFGYVTPLMKDSHTDVVFNIIKLRFGLYGFGVFFFTYRFFRRSYYLFLKIFVISSIIILLVFLQSIITDWRILPYEIIDRGFISINRNLLLSYGLMPWLSFFGVTIIVFGFRNNVKFRFIIGFLLMYMTWIVSLTRRHIFGLIIIFGLAYILFNYIHKLGLSKLTLVLARTSIIVLLIFSALWISFPSYFEPNIEVIKNTVQILQSRETESGTAFERLDIYGRYTMVYEFEKSPYLGTGFNNLWRTKEGDTAGYEASDYPFQAALAMAGILGLLAFFPIYYLLFRMLYKDLKYIKKHKLNRYSYSTFVLLSLILLFLYILVQYMNWFSPISNADDISFYVAISLYAATREIFYSEEFNKKINKRDLRF